MKDAIDLKSYRTKYKRHFGIKFGSDFDIHHMDFDRNNNDISNLLLLPKELHVRYHAILRSLRIADGFLDVRLSNAVITDYSAFDFDLLPQIIEECSKWVWLKRNNYYSYNLPDGIVLTKKGGLICQ